MQQSKHIFPILLFIAVLLSSCTRYAFDVNNNAVFEPPSLVQPLAVADPRLMRCIEQTIEDLEAEQIGDIVTLSCSSAGIKSIEGLQQYSRIESLNLRNNAIADISALSQLASLKRLDIRENDLSHCGQLERIIELLGSNVLSDAECQ